MIRIILFIPEESGPEGLALKNTVRTRFYELDQEICSDLETLKKALTRPVRFGDLDIFVLLAETRAKLEELLSLEKYVDDKKILLILPDNEHETYASGFRLYPRFVTLKADFETYVYDVLEKMIAYHNRK